MSDTVTINKALLERLTGKFGEPSEADKRAALEVVNPPAPRAAVAQHGTNEYRFFRTAADGIHLNGNMSGDFLSVTVLDGGPDADTKVIIVTGPAFPTNSTIMLDGTGVNR
jgi:hypothetical protein